VTVDWVIEFKPYDGRLHSIPPRMTESERYTTYTGAASNIDHTFSYPGDYFVCVRESGAAAEYGSGAAAADGACTTIQNRYVHRELSLVTDEEWSAFAYAMNVVKSTSTSDGRAQFGPNCLQSDNEFYTHDAFVALHLTLAGNRSGDQLHILELQEPAHQAWTSKLQQALRCVDRSVSHVWSDFTHDYDHTDGTDKGMVGTRVFSADRYGSAMNHDIPGDDPAYVTDGAFANWTVTQTDDVEYLCGDLKEMVSEETMLRCMDQIQNNRGVGYTSYQPRPKEQLEFVSRRPYYMLAKNSNICAKSTSTFASLRNAMTDPKLNLTHVQSLTLASALHGVAHDCASGKWWSPTSPVPGFTAAFLQALGARSSEELMSSNSFLVSVSRIVLGNDRANNVMFDLNNEILCHENYCECQPFFNPFSMTNPDLDLDMLLNDYPNSLVGSSWARYIRNRGPLYLNGCNWPRSGTYDWSAAANQDPLFYAFHWHTFAWVHLGAQNVMAKTGVTFVEQARELLKNEHPGGRFDDITRFKDLVPYREGQVEGSFHTWQDILTHFFSFEESVFEYPEYKTTYDDPAYRAGIHAAQCLQHCALIDLGLVYEVLYHTLAALPAGTLFAIPNLPCPTFIGMFESSLSTSSMFAPCYAPSPPPSPPPMPPPLPPALPPQPPPCEPTSMTLVTIDFTANWAAASQLGTLAGTVWTGMKWLLKTSEGVAHEFEHPVKTVSNFPCGAPSFLGLPLPEPDCECGLQNTFHPPVELECGVEYTIETTPVSDMTNMFATSENSLCPLWYFVPTANLEQLREGMVMMCENSDFQLEGAAGGPKTTAYVTGRQKTFATVDDIGAACGSDYTKTIAVANGAPCAHASPGRTPSPLASRSGLTGVQTSIVPGHHPGAKGIH